MITLIKVDYFITQLLNKIIPHNLFFDYFFSFFSLKGNSIFIWILIIIVITFLEEKKNPGISYQDKKFILVFSLSFLITAFIISYLIKPVFRRPRPTFLNLTQIKNINKNFNCPTDFSFPSTHAATAFAAATILTFFDKKRRFFYYTIAILIAYSRIYLSCHYFFDIVFGGIFGLIISKLIINFF